MPEAIVVIALLVVGALWWLRPGKARTAADETAAMLQRVRTSVRQERLRAENGPAELTEIDDPVLAAAILILAIVSGGQRITWGREKMLHEVLADVSSETRARQAVDHARSAAVRTLDAGTVIDMLTPLLRERLDEAEKGDLIVMARRVATVAGPPLPMLETRMHRLRQRLGVVVH